MNEPEGLERFTVSERLVHWAFALGYLLLLVSGLPLMFPWMRGWIRGYDPVVGLRLHLVAAVLWMLATLAVVAVADRRVLKVTGRDLVRFRPGDGAWLKRFPRWVFARGVARARYDASVGRFNAGQKVNAIFTAATSALLLLTGLALVPVDGNGMLLAALVTGTRSLDVWRQAHRILTWLVIVPVLGHIFLALLFPATRPSFAGMVWGSVSREWAVRHHPRWAEETSPLTLPSPPKGERRLGPLSPQGRGEG